MKTVRLGEQLEAKVDRIAEKTGKTVSQVIRDAVEKHCETVGGESVYDRLADLIGTVSSDGQTDARNSSKEFGELVRKKHDPSRRRSL